MKIETPRHTQQSRASRRLLASLMLALAHAACSGVADEGPTRPDDDEEETETETETGEHAVVKFCNDLQKSGQDITLTLEVGYPDPVRISASSGTCAPGAPAACARIPAGTDVPVTLRDGHQVIAQGALGHVRSGSEWILIAGLDDVRNEPEIEGGELKPEFRCSEIE